MHVTETQDKHPPKNQRYRTRCVCRFPVEQRMHSRHAIQNNGNTSKMWRCKLWRGRVLGAQIE